MTSCKLYIFQCQAGCFKLIFEKQLRTNNFYLLPDQFRLEILGLSFYFCKKGFLFTLTLPAITTLFEIDPGFINNNVANCYLYAADFKAVKTVTGAATVKLNRIFKKYETTGFTLALDDKAAVTSDKKSSDLATVGTDAASVGMADETYVTLSGDLGKEKGYDQTLNFTISSKRC